MTITTTIFVLQHQYFVVAYLYLCLYKSHHITQPLYVESLTLGTDFRYYLTIILINNGKISDERS